jgi:hypothetical protein
VETLDVNVVGVLQNVGHLQSFAKWDVHNHSSIAFVASHKETRRYLTIVGALEGEVKPLRASTPTHRSQPSQRTGFALSVQKVLFLHTLGGAPKPFAKGDHSTHTMDS